MKKKLLAVVLSMALITSGCTFAFADDAFDVISNGGVESSITDKIDVLQYFGMTYNEVFDLRDGLFESIDSLGSGKTFLTDSRLAFYFEYNYDEDIRNAKVNRIVITNNDVGRSFIGDDMCICATYADEIIYMESNGVKNICTLGDLRKVWVNDEYVVIVSRGPYAGCCEIDISKNADGMY